MCAEKTCLCLHTGCKESTRTPLCTICINRERHGKLPAMSNNKAYPPAPHNPPNGPHTCSLHLDSLPTSYSRVQPEQAEHSVHRWFGLSCSKFSRHLNKSQYSFLSCPLSPISLPMRYKIVVV